MVKKIIWVSGLAMVVTGGLIYQSSIFSAMTENIAQASKVQTDPLLVHESRLTVKPTASQLAHQQEVKQSAQQEETTQPKVVQQETAKPAVQTANTNQPAQSAQPTVTSSVGLFRFLGRSYALRDFNGKGGDQVPTSPYVYRWTQSSTPWYLVEQSGAAGAYIQAVGLGDKVEIDGRTYTVTDIARHLPSQAGTSGAGSVALAYYDTHRSQHAAGFQTCDNNDYETLWFLD